MAIVAGTAVLVSGTRRTIKPIAPTRTAIGKARKMLHSRSVLATPSTRFTIVESDTAGMATKSRTDSVVHAPSSFSALRVALARRAIGALLGWAELTRVPIGFICHAIIRRDRDQ